MYWTLLIKPSIQSHIVQRLVNENERNVPYTSQPSENIQECIGKVMCATFDEVVKIQRYMETELQCFNINNGAVPAQEGLDLFQGPITGVRYLLNGEEHDGEYRINPAV